MPPSPVSNGGSGPMRRPSEYKRAYKACEACRRTKRECELQPTVSETTCVRCCRERRTCLFPERRSTKRAKVAQQQVSASSNGDAMIGISASFPDAVQPASANPSADQRMAGSPAFGEAQPWQTGLPSDRRARLQSDAGNFSDNLAKTMVTSSKDAIGLLFQAAEQNESDSRSNDEDDDPAGLQLASRDGFSDAASPLMYCEAQLPPQLSKETLALWNQHRFVVQGWFSAMEAISYLQFFLDRFAALSPVADFFYADHDTHKRLILDEPLLCCTILMIASRHLPAQGRSGKTRSAFIHARLWRHIEHLVQRITFGTEKYSRAKSRTLGSIEALLLIIEWHSRLLHFPPENDGWDASLAATVDDSFPSQDKTSETARRWREDVFEPAKRSDRLSWTLVGLAITLGHELGVFDPQLDDVGTTDPAALAQQKTKMRIRKLLYLYSQQLSLRLGCPNMFPQGDRSVLQTARSSDASNADQAIMDREILLSKWIDITKLLATATHMFFSSPTTIQNILKSYQYVSLLEHFQPLLTRWYEDFSRTPLTTIAAAAKQAVLVEYYYTRMYVSSIALQALVERANQAGAGDTWLEEDFWRKECVHDTGFISDVTESSGQILVITKKLSDYGILPYLPVRFFLRVVAASIFLLKTICLGTKGTDAKIALDQLEDAVQALMANDSDDIHLASRYAELIARHVRKLKRKLHSKRSNKASASKVTTSQPNGVASRSELSQRDLQALAPPDISTSFPNGSAEGLAADLTLDGMSASADSWSDSFWKDWLGQPLDPLIAPFGIEPAQAAAGLTSDSLDFLWSSNIT